MKIIGSTYRSRVVNVTLEGRAVSMDTEGGEETDAATAGRIKRPNRHLKNEDIFQR